MHSKVAVGSPSVNVNVALLATLGAVGDDVITGGGGITATASTPSVCQDDVPAPAAERTELPACLEVARTAGPGAGFCSLPRFLGACCWKPARASAPCTPRAATGACETRS